MEMISWIRHGLKCLYLSGFFVLWIIQPEWYVKQKLCGDVYTFYFRKLPYPDMKSLRQGGKEI